MVLPEVQATVKAPSTRNMYKGISMCYIIIAVSYLAVAITGYWAFGAAVNPFVVYSFGGPQWAVTLALLLAIIQIVGCYQVCVCMTRRRPLCLRALPGCCRCCCCVGLAAQPIHLAASQLSTQIYTRPTYEYFEILLAHHDESPMSRWNVAQRALITTVYMVVVTTVCCAVPFFIDFVALV
jgi:amino acid permease